MIRCFAQVGAAMLLLTGCQSHHRARPRPWVELEQSRPRVDLPHILRIGTSFDVVRIKVGNAWKEVVRSQFVDLTTLDGDAVLVSHFDPRWAGIFTADGPRPRSIDLADCDVLRVSPDGRQIACTACAVPTRGVTSCAEAQVSVFDVHAVRISSARIRPPEGARCALGPALFTAGEGIVLPFDCRAVCYFVSAPGSFTIAERPGSCPLEARELKDLNLSPGRSPVEP